MTLASVVTRHGPWPTCATCQEAACSSAAASTQVTPQPGLPPRWRHRRLHRGRLRRHAVGLRQQSCEAGQPVLPGGTPAQALLPPARATIAGPSAAWGAMYRGPTARDSGDGACARTVCRPAASSSARTANPGGNILWEPGGAQRGARPALRRLTPGGRCDSDRRRGFHPGEEAGHGRASIASSRGPSAVEQASTTTSVGGARSSRLAQRRDTT